MPDLIAQGQQSQHRWRKPLLEGETLVVGRGAVALQVPWDDRISREHVELCWGKGELQVVRRPTARNPLFFQGAAVDRAALKPGQHFVLGQTMFTVTNDHVLVSLAHPQPVEEQTYSPQALQQVQFRHADRRIEVLARLPEVISSSASDQELFERLVNMLLAGIPRSDAVAVVAADPSLNDRIDVLYWDRRRTGGADFQPSHGLIVEALERQQSVLHRWHGGGSAGYTMQDNLDWAFAIPVIGPACNGWAIYVAGRNDIAADSTDPSDLREDLKFTELVAATLSALRRVRQLQSSNAILSQFFTPVVLNAVGTQGADEALSPRETEVTVLFCDLRGFSMAAEKSAADLLGLLNRVSQALGVMTRHIRESGGVIGDYQGDAAMGFWGWPIEQPDAVQRACLAALAIRADFESAAKRPGDPLADFRAGIGIATGRAVAGKIGTEEQVKVTVFGPVVNLASRLEGMTKILRAPILVDKRVADVVRATLPCEQARVRRIAVVKPYGMATPLEVSELLPPVDQFPLLTDQHIADYEAAVAALQKGDWTLAFDLLHRVPPEDRVKDFLTVLIAQHHRAPPTNWDGVIRMSSKD